MENNLVVSPELKSYHVVVVQSPSHVWLFVTPWTAACQASLSFTISWSLLKLMSIELIMSSNHLMLGCSLLLLPSVFPSIRVFSNELALHQGSKVLELQLQHQSLGLTGLISYCPRDSQEFSPAPQFKSISSSVLNLLYGLNLTSVHDYWKNCSSDSMDLLE